MAAAYHEQHLPAATSLLGPVTIQIKRAPEYGPGTIPLIVPAHTLHPGPSIVLLVNALKSQEAKDALTMPLELATKVLQQLTDTALKSGNKPAGIPHVAIEPEEDNQDQDPYGDDDESEGD